ncbi:MAG: metallophosphoesterase [Clostridia bacterium]|nr:metallophosphoesterase [Clostridia bacterium]
MKYFCADIHGDCELLVRLLDKIKFNSCDELFIGGDLIDKGENSIKTVRLVKSLPNAYPILGNHEHEFLSYYHSVMSDCDDTDKALSTLKENFPDGELLDYETLDYIESLPYYIEREDFILVHAGLPLDGERRVIQPDKAKVESLVYDRVFKEPNLNFKTDKCVFFGHTPTTYICGKPKILAYLKSGATGDKISDYTKIHLDTGTWLNGVLGCFCLDNCHAYYVKK